MGHKSWRNQQGRGEGNGRAGNGASKGTKASKAGRFGSNWFEGAPNRDLSKRRVRVSHREN